MHSMEKMMKNKRRPCFMITKDQWIVIVALEMQENGFNAVFSYSSRGKNKGRYNAQIFPTIEKENDGQRHSIRL